jgi:hypothetical protein
MHELEAPVYSVRYDPSMRIEKRCSGSAALRLACALALAGSVPGCITYSTAVAKDSSYRELGITVGLAAVEIGTGVLGGYVVHDDKVANADGKSLGMNMLEVTGGILLVDAIIALGLYLSDS